MNLSDCNELYIQRKHLKQRSKLNIKVIKVYCILKYILDQNKYRFARLANF